MNTRVTQFVWLLLGLSFQVFAQEETDTLPKETLLRYPAFTVRIHDFKGYETEGEIGQRTYLGQFGGDGATSEQAHLNEDEIENLDYHEALIVVKDTLEISEILFDDRINNTLFEIIPQNEKDSFALSFCYLTSLNEIVDYSRFSEAEQALFDYNKLIHIPESTPFITIADSARLFFRALPHSSDMVAVDVVDGQLVFDTNSAADIALEEQQFATELERIKLKHGLRDTLVEFPSEYTTIATLTKENTLFNYDYVAFQFRITRYSVNGEAETKYIIIYIAYGC
jgi:hypothetical protein